MQQTELSQLLKKINLKAWELLFYIMTALKILFMDLIKSRSLVSLSPATGHCSSFSFCLYTIHSSQLIKMKSLRIKFEIKINKVLCLIKKCHKEKM